MLAAMDSPAESPWTKLPREEHGSVWQQTEYNFWSDFRAKQEREDAELDAEYHSARLSLTAQTNAKLEQRRDLKQREKAYYESLYQVQAELAALDEACKQDSGRSEELDAVFRKKVDKRTRERRDIEKQMVQFFEDKRIKATTGYRPGDYSPHHEAMLPPKSMAAPLPHPATTAPVPKEYTNGHPTTTNPARPSTQHTREIATLVDADGGVVGPLYRIEPWNQFVQVIMELPVRRSIQIRRGRKFTDENLHGLYDRSESRGVKWLACMIQATGAVQSRRCQCCEKHQGAFEQCVVVGGDLFPKCGNCEWNRQGCHGSSGEGVSYRALEEKRPADTIEAKGPPVLHGVDKQLSPTSLQRQYDHDAVARDAMAKASGMAQSILQQKTQSDAIQPPTPTDMTRRYQTPYAAPTVGFKAANIQPAPLAGFTAANTRSRPPSREAPTPIPGSLSPQSLADTSHLEITKSNLLLRDNGAVYTYPDMVEGVPVEKIDERHPYWEPTWKNIKDIIQPQLDTWKVKHGDAIENKGGSSKYQIGRQVNRGIQILQFLDDGAISPYQLVGKKYMSVGKGGITSYDTLFRLCDTLDQLCKFKLDVRPVDWLRHRLYEIMQEEGPEFSLPRTVHDFYHDPKLAHLRRKNGMKDIGRPSGRGKDKGRESLVMNGKESPLDSRKRKSTHPTNTPAQTPPMPNADYTERSPLVVHALISEDFSMPKRPKPSPNTARAQPVLNTPPPATPLTVTALTHFDDFHTDDYSDTDSFSGVAIYKNDYRLTQVKTRLYTSSPNVTQYWHWHQGTGQLEHQVLKNDKGEWAYQKEPINFHVKLSEISEVVWDLKSLRVHVVVRTWGSPTLSKKDNLPRGDVMACFARERTAKRFLQFCREQRLRMVREPTAEMDRRWQEMQSAEQLTDDTQSSKESKP